MKLVIDTNVLISAVFFGGKPRKVVESVIRGNVKACASGEIIEEYEEVLEEMISRKQGVLRKDLFQFLMKRIEITQPVSEVRVCRDPDDDKFISCAMDAGALYIVSGDKDLLDIGKYEGVTIITAAEFCKRFPLFMPESY